MTVLRAQDGLNIGFCAAGQRKMCLKYGISVVDFFRGGVEVSLIDHIEDHNVKAAIAEAFKREKDEREKQQG